MAHWMGLWSCKSLFDCGWLLQLSTGIIGFIALYLFIKKILKNKRFQSLEEWLGYKFEAHKIFLTSMKIIFWSLGIYYSAEIIVEQFGCKDCIKGLRPLRDALVVLSISWMIYRMQQEFSHAKKMRIRGLVHAFSKIFSDTFFYTPWGYFFYNFRRFGYKISCLFNYFFWLNRG